MPDAIYIEPLEGAECRSRGADRRIRDADRRIAQLAEDQHGVVGRRQLLEMGIGRRAVGGRIERGTLHPVHRGVYAVGHSLLNRRGRWMAAVLACEPGALLSHRSAGQLWGILPRSAAVPEVTRRAGSRLLPEIVVHRSLVPADERTAIDGIPVTSLVRTYLDLAALLTTARLERSLNEAEVLGLTDRVSIPELLKRYPRRRGSAALRALFRDETALRGVTQNDFEELFAALVDAHDLPRPRFNADLAIRGRFIKPDALWAEARLIVELDGRATHGTARAFEKDRERDRLLLGEGWQVVRLTWSQVRDDGPAIAAELRKLLRERHRPPTLKR